MKRFRAVLALTAAGAIAFVASASTPVLTALHVDRPTGRLDHVAVAAQPTATAASGAPNIGMFTAMTAAMNKIGHNIQMRTVGSVMNASYDPAHDSAMADVKNGTIEIDEIVSHGKIFIRANLGSDLDMQIGITPDTWMTMDPTQIKADNQLLVQPDASDPVDMAGITAGITSLQRTDSKHLTGVMDLSKVTGHTVPNPDEVLKAGAPATAVPFTVRADGSGRISEFTVSADAFDPSLSLDVIYTDYGSPAAVTPPTSAIAAPASLYGAFNG